MKPALYQVLCEIKEKTGTAGNGNYFLRYGSEERFWWLQCSVIHIRKGIPVYTVTSSLRKMYAMSCLI